MIHTRYSTLLGYSLCAVMALSTSVMWANEPELQESPAVEQETTPVAEKQGFARTTFNYVTGAAVLGGLGFGGYKGYLYFNPKQTDGLIAIFTTTLYDKESVEKRITDLKNIEKRYNQTFVINDNHPNGKFIQKDTQEFTYTPSKIKEKVGNFIEIQLLRRERKRKVEIRVKDLTNFELAEQKARQEMEMSCLIKRDKFLTQFANDLKELSLRSKKTVEDGSPNFPQDRKGDENPHVKSIIEKQKLFRKSLPEVFVDDSKPERDGSKPRRKVIVTSRIKTKRRKIKQSSS